MTLFSVSSPSDSAAIVILAGGMSSRFGSDKALAPWNDRGSILDNVIEAAYSSCSQVALSVKEASDYPEKKIRKIPDVIKGMGPLGGLYSAFVHLEAQWIMVLACDMPLVEPLLLRHMLGLKTWAPAIVPYCRGRFEPLHAIYHRSLLPLVEYLLENRRLKMRQLLDPLPKYLVSEAEVIKVAGSLECLSNINTLQEFKRLSPRNFFQK